MSSTIQGSSKQDGEGRDLDMKDVVLFYGGLPYENEIVEAYRKYLPQTSSDDFVGMKAANWGANAVEGHLNDVHLAGWPRGSARARLSDWVGCGGGAAGSGHANGSGSAAAKVRAEAEEVKSPEDVAVEQTLLVLEDPKTASMTTKEVKIEAAKRVRAETGKNSEIECRSLYGRVLRSHGTGAELRKARSGEDPDSVTRQGDGLLRVTTSVKMCISSKWKTEAEYNTAYSDMLYQTEVDGKHYITQRLRELHEFALKLPDAQRLPYIKRAWVESECGVPLAVNARLLDRIQVEWANSLTLESGCGGQTDVSKLLKRIEMLEANGKKEKTAESGHQVPQGKNCYCCNEPGHRALECKLACKKCSTSTKAVKIGSYFCDCEVGNGGN